MTLAIVLGGRGSVRDTESTSAQGPVRRPLLALVLEARRHPDEQAKELMSAVCRHDLPVEGALSGRVERSSTC